MNFGWGNGYVLIPIGHPLHGKDYTEIENIDVNGGLTFSEVVDKKLIERYEGLKEEDEGCWMVGFDTCHSWDTLEAWPKENVQAEADKLKEQLINYLL